jgi:hypothetical protein
LLCWVVVPCGIYKSSYNMSNTSYLNSPLPQVSFIPLPFDRSHFSIFIHEYIVLYHIHPPTPFPYILLSPTGVNLPRVDLFSPSVLWFCIRKEKEEENDIFVTGIFILFSKCKMWYHWVSIHHVAFLSFVWSNYFMILLLSVSAFFWNNKIFAYYFNLLTFFLFFGSTGVWTQGLMFVMQPLLLLQPDHQPVFAMVFFKIESWKLFPWVWPWTSILLISAFWEARITVWAAGSWL